MGVLWPVFLLLLAALPLIVLAYVLALRRRRRFAVPYSSLSLIAQAMPGGIRWRRHLPFVLALLAIALLVLALSRPYANVTVASSRTTVILALDVSLSMCADDIDPNRLTVAQEAAIRFIEGQEADTRVGIVAFAGFAQLIVPPTTDRDDLIEAVANLTTARRTAVGSAIVRSLEALSEVNPAIAPVSVNVPAVSEAEPIPEENLQPDVIVLLTDGANTRGVQPLDAARAARDRGVQVYTIGFGTASPAVLQCTPEQLGGEDLPFRGRGRRIRRVRRVRRRAHQRQLPEPGRADPEPRRRDHRGRVLPGGQRRRALRGLRRNPGADREEEGAHGGVGHSDRRQRRPGPLRRRPEPPLEPAAVRGCVTNPLSP